MGIYTSTVQKLYVAFFNRPGDAAGVPFWEAQLTANGGDVSAIATAFGASSEYTSLFTGQDNLHIVNTLYNNLFGRDAEPAGLLFWANRLTAGSDTVASLALTLANNAQGTDLDVVNNKITASTSFTDSLTTTSQILGYSGLAANAVARTWLSTVTSDTASVTTATASISATITAATAASTNTAGSSFSLTTASDVITGTSGNDTITGNAGTVGGADEISGGSGTDAATLKLGSANVVAPVISSVETITLDARDGTGTFDMINVSGTTTLNVQGITNLAVSGLTNSGSLTVQSGYSANLTLALATNTATAQAFTVNFNDASGADVIIASDSGTTAVDTLTLNAVTNWGHGTSLSFSGMEKVVLKGDGTIDLNFDSAAGGIEATGVNDLTAIDASSMTGALTLTYDDAVSINVAGGAGNDTITMTANLDTNDSLVGGAGTDTLNAVLTGGYVRPIVSGIESLNLLVNSTAATADFRDITGVSTIDLLLGTGVVLDKLGSAVTTLNVNSSDSTANGLTVQYGTGAGASTVTLNLGTGSSVLATTNATASGMGIGTITMSGNSGSLTIITDSTAKYSAAAIELNDFTAVTLNAASANLVVDSAVDVNTAQTLSLAAAAGKTLTIGDDLSADSVTLFSVSAAQSATVTFSETASLNAAGATITLAADASASIDFSAVQLSGATSLTINVGVGGLVSANNILFGEAGATAGSGAIAMSTINISAAGDVSIVGATLQSASTAVSLTLNATLVGTGTAADVGLSAITLTDVASAATASEQSVTLNISGTGQFKYSAATTDSSNITYHVNATGLASSSMITIDLSNVDDTGSVASAVFGAASGLYIGVDGADNVEAGLGAVTINGGLGADTITFNNTAANIAQVSVSTVAGVDTIVGAGVGDVVLFSNAVTATANTYLTAALGTGTATNTAQVFTQSFSAMGSSVATTGAATLTAVQQIAIYTAAGDTIIEVLGTTAVFATLSGAGPASASDDFVRVVLSNKDFTAITAAFQLNSNGSGLSITLL